MRHGLAKWPRLRRRCQPYRPLASVGNEGGKLGRLSAVEPSNPKDNWQSHLWRRLSRMLSGCGSRWTHPNDKYGRRSFRQNVRTAQYKGGVWECLIDRRLTSPIAHAMIISSTASVLDPAGFGTPDLAALKPDVSSYKAILFQPHGDIEVSASGVRHRNRDLAVAQFGGFLRVANETRADLAICPEYSMPWNVLIDAINSGQRPPGRGLWIFGCESIRYSELDHARQP